MSRFDNSLPFRRSPRHAEFHSEPSQPKSMRPHAKSTICPSRICSAWQIARCAARSGFTSSISPISLHPATPCNSYILPFHSPVLPDFSPSPVSSRRQNTQTQTLNTQRRDVRSQTHAMNSQSYPASTQSRRVNRQGLVKNRQNCDVNRQTRDVSTQRTAVSGQHNTGYSRHLPAPTHRPLPLHPSPEEYALPIFQLSSFNLQLPLHHA